MHVYNYDTVRIGVSSPWRHFEESITADDENVTAIEDEQVCRRSILRDELTQEQIETTEPKRSAEPKGDASKTEKGSPQQQ